MRRAIRWGMVHKERVLNVEIVQGADCALWRLCSVEIVHCTMCKVQCALWRASSGCDTGRHCWKSRLLPGLRMHCCDSYHWPKAPREIYDESRIAHNTRQGAREEVYRAGAAD